MMPNRLFNLWPRLTEPSVAIREPERRRRARLLSALLLASVLATVLVVIVTPWQTGLAFNLQQPFHLVVIVALVLLVTAYGLSRTAHYTLAAWFTVGLCSPVTFLAVIAIPQAAMMPAFLILAVLLSSLLLSPRVTAFVTAVTVGEVLLLPVFVPEMDMRNVFGTLNFVIVTAILMLIAVAIRQRDQQQIEQQSAALQKTHQEARARAAQGEQRASELAEVMIALAAQDFSQRAPVSGENDVFDALATGLNMLSEELAASIQALQESQERLQTVISNVPVVLFALDTEGRFILSEGRGLEPLGLQPGQMVGQSAFEVYRDTPRITANIRRALSGEAFGDTVEVAGLVFESWYAPLRRADGQVAGVIGVASDVTERVQYERQARAAVAELDKRKLAEALRAATSTLNITLNLDEVLERVLENLSTLVPYDSAAVLLKHGDQLRVAALRGFADPEVGRRLRIPLTGDDLFAEIARTRKPRSISDLRLQIADWGDSAAPNAQSEIHNLQSTMVRAWLGVPLVHGEEVIGLLALYSHTEAAYSEYLAEIAFTLAGQAVFAIENARLFGEVHRLATTDGLTGVYNRRHFFELAEREVQRARRSGRPLSAIMLDIDHFKRVNDSYGHAVGDQVLRVVAGRCQENVRTVDLLGRYGGEEFAVLLPETDLHTACQVAERLRQSITTVPIQANGMAVTISISAGVAATEGPAAALDALLNAADTALYRAKQEGRNRVIAV